MRQTLHLIPAADFYLFIRALEKSRFQALLRIMSKFGITTEEVDDLNETIVEALNDGPLGQRELTERIRRRVGKKVREWMARFWNPSRPAMVKGLICHGPNRGKESTFVRVDRWLSDGPNIEEVEAKRILLSRYLSAYGPATLQDFSRWSGIPVGEATAVWNSLAGELVGVWNGDQERFLLREDYQDLAGAGFANPVMRFLPAFDSYLLGHAVKSHLLDEQDYKRVYRSQWWISPTVLLNGRIVGTWSLVRTSKRIRLEIGFFGKVPRSLDALVEGEATSLGSFLETPVEVKKH